MSETATPWSDDQLIEQFIERRAERLVKAWGSYQPCNPIASDLSDCRRYQVMRIVAWQVREPPDADGKEVIEQGQLMEPMVIRQMQDEGWEVVEYQAPFEIRQPAEPGGPVKTLLTGKIDGKLRAGRELILLESKDTSEYTLDALDSQADLAHSQWTRRWRRQANVYMLGENLERGLLMLSYRGRRKPIPLRLDYDEAEQTLQLCGWAVQLTEDLVTAGVTHETVDKALAERGVPYHDAYSVCRSCPFRDRACYPPQPSKTRVQVRADLLTTIERYVVISPMASESERLRKRLKSETEGFDKTVAGQFVVSGEWKKRKMKYQPAIDAHTQTYWGFKVGRTSAAAPTSATEGGEKT